VTGFQWHPEVNNSFSCADSDCSIVNFNSQILFSQAHNYSHALLLVHLYYSYVTSLLNDAIEKCFRMGHTKYSTHGGCHSDNSVCSKFFSQVRTPEFDSIVICLQWCEVLLTIYAYLWDTLTSCERFSSIFYVFLLILING